MTDEKINPKGVLSQFNSSSDRKDILAALEWRCSQSNNDPSNLRDVEAKYLIKLLDTQDQERLLDEQKEFNRKMLSWQRWLVFGTWLLAAGTFLLILIKK